MNFQTEVILKPLRVLIVNPLSPSGQMIITKILSGFVFGPSQLIDLTILVYSNEKPIGERLKINLIQCAYRCYNTITVSSDLPGASDADVFCFLSNFYNLNKVSLDKMDTDDQFDALYLIIKIANNFTSLPVEKAESLDDGVKFKKKSKRSEEKPRKPIFMADGLVAMDILKTLSKGLSPDVFFCPTTIPDIAKSVLADYLKVQCNELNDVFVWAADDEVFHIELEKPIIVRDEMDSHLKCDWDMIGKETLRTIDLDATQFSPSWMKKEFIAKVAATSLKNPYGSIFRATLFVRALKAIWASRLDDSGKKVYCNMGVISDGSLGTTKGYPYVLPLIFSGDTWTINKCFEESAHLRGELNRINKTIRKQHQRLIPFCKRFLQENVLNQAFIPVSEESSSGFASTISSSVSNV